MATILITGINGFVGKHLAHELVGQGHGVIGAGLDQQLHPELSGLIKTYVACDLTQQEAVEKLPLLQLDAVISLAGLAAVGKSFDNPELYKKVNVAVLHTICEALLRQKANPRVIAVSTGAVYDPAQPMPLVETSKLVTQGSPYAESKILMEEAAKSARDKGLDCVVVRPFNHIGPGQEPGFLVPDLYAKIKNAMETDSPVHVGNLKTKRDYTDVRDVVKAYASLALAERLQYDIYNVCSQKSVSGDEVLTTMLKAISNANGVKIEQDQSLIRPNDPLDLYGSHDRLTHDTGWQPQFAFDQTIQDFVGSFN